MVKNFTTNEGTYSSNQDLGTEITENNALRTTIKSALNSFVKTPQQKTINSILAYSKSLSKY